MESDVVLVLLEELCDEGFDVVVLGFCGDGGGGRWLDSILMLGIEVGIGLL